MAYCCICGNLLNKRHKKYDVCSEKCRKKFLWDNNINGYKDKARGRTKSLRCIFEISKNMKLGQILCGCVYCGVLYTANTRSSTGCPDCYKKINKVRIYNHIKEWRSKNKDKTNGYHRKYYHKHNNRDKIRLYQKKWLNKIGGIQIYRKVKNKKCYIGYLLRNRLKNAFHYYKINKKFPKHKSIDYKPAIEKLINTIPSDLDKQKYHIDHIIPLSKFDLTNSEEIKKAFAPDNLQWLPALDNIKKGNRII